MSHSLELFLATGPIGTLRGTMLFLFSKIDPVIVFVLLSCYSVVTILLDQISD